MAPSAENVYVPTDPGNPLKQYPSTGIEVLIIGGGSSGLYLALECVRQGHKPTIIESKPEEAQPSGDFFVLGDSATGVLKYWPHMKKAFDECAQDTQLNYYRHDGSHLFGPFIMPQRVGKILVRKQMHNLMIDEVKRQNIPIYYGDKVVDYFESSTKGGVVLASGKRLEADVVAACDGVHSRSWKLVLGYKDEPRSSGFSIFRCSMPTEQAMAHPQVREKFYRKIGVDGKVHDTLEFLMGPHISANMAISKDVSCWLCVYKDNKPDTETSESWGHVVQPSEVLEKISYAPGWDPVFLELVKSSPPIVDWRIMTRNPQPKWVSDKGRVVQCGDSAHVFVPTSANGATQAMEDAISLATCLRLGGSPEEVPKAVRVHNKLRFERVSCSQLSGLLTKERLHQTDWEMVKQNPSLLRKLLETMGPGNWIANHNPEEYAIDNFALCAQSLKPGSTTAFVNTNFPPGYVYERWDAQKILKDAADGKRIQVGGDWS